MTVTKRADGVIALTGSCPVEDAEALLQLLLAAPSPRVDWSACESAHTAVVQVLIASGIAPSGEPKTQFLREHISGALGRSQR
jgi:hypothetical protein